ncbi:hypothetical protein CKO42_22035 [Lamprobacter modestohalophilus]|uniref:Uncharacterized protein n=1 Tax=Lamprobacter modestohalophilus TaxID=1064514 RepID=A0A9X0WCT1_9GAMM|nr:hypothetical protein [Lamprobacter modestohalophilus]MBK1621052.1 hypothetical protein [Lamprobacter modestohalophilus]
MIPVGIRLLMSFETPVVAAGIRLVGWVAQDGAQSRYPAWVQFDDSSLEALMALQRLVGGGEPLSG